MTIILWSPRHNCILFVCSHCDTYTLTREECLAHATTHQQEKEQP